LSTREADDDAAWTAELAPREGGVAAGKKKHKKAKKKPTKVSKSAQ
jgi:hypothetical protein